MTAICPTTQLQLERLFSEAYGVAPATVEPLAAHASKRKMFRLSHSEGKLSCVAVLNDYLEENDAFVCFAQRFAQAGLPVPNVQAYNRQAGIYLVEDLGNETLYDRLCAHSPECHYTPAVLPFYEKVTALLPTFQTKAAQLITTEDCFEGAYFNAEGAREDIRAFDVYFLQLALPDFDFIPVRDELSQFALDCCRPEEFEFMHRDFQSRNIMLCNEEPYIIDFQSGRFGPPQYDLASLLYQAQAKIPESAREGLLNHYLQHRDSIGPQDKEAFTARFYQIAVLRQIQVLSAYGRLGLREGKSYFLESIPLALNNLQSIRETQSIDKQLPRFYALIGQLQDKFCA